jgi:ketosteroid isomerase-like protein
MTDDLHDFREFMKQRERVGQAFAAGDATPLGGIVSRGVHATFFGPGGGSERGGDHVFSTYEHDAAQFEPGGESHFEVMELAASHGLAYWVGFQQATARLKGKKEPISLRLRITEVFRREGDAWKLLHRHADSLSEPKARQP